MNLQPEVDVFHPGYFLQQAPLLQPPPAPAAFALPELQKPASSALNHNNYPKNCTAESARGDGNEAQRHHRLPPLTIRHRGAALEEDASAWDGAICSRHEDDEKRAPQRFWCPESTSDLCRSWQLLWGLAAGPASPGAQAYRTRKDFFIW